MKKRDGYVGGRCDPQKATTCKKENCHINGGMCRSTTNIKWISDKEKEKWYKK